MKFVCAVPSHILDEGGGELMLYKQILIMYSYKWIIHYVLVCHCVAFIYP